MSEEPPKVEPGEVARSGANVAAGAPTATRSGNALPAKPDIELLLTEPRLAVLGILVTIGLGAAGVALTLCDRGWVGAVAGAVSVGVAWVLLRFKRPRGWLAWLSEKVLPLQETRSK